MIRVALLCWIILLGFSGCAVPNALSIAVTPDDYISKFGVNNCDQSYFENELQKAKNNKDPIYTAINAASIARVCQEFALSNELLDIAEDKYKYDVDLESTGNKIARNLVSVLLNDTFSDYDGNLYERIMVNLYKGLNFMSLNEFENARVEFNRALIRQDMAKEYFAPQIQAAKEKLEKEKSDPNYKENLKNAKLVYDEYSRLFKEFKTSENFINPYATYAASVFFYLDKDYKNSADKFREIAIANPKNKAISAINQRLQTRAKNVKSKGKKYIFLAYEDGLGTIKNEFAMNIPYIISDGVATVSLSLPMLKKRDFSYKDISINGVKATQISNFDNIFASEFKIELPWIITKSILSGAIKSTTSAIVASEVGGVASLATTFLLSATNKADIRVWQTLPKIASIAMVENKGSYTIKDSSGKIIASDKIDKSKDALIWLRSSNKDMVKSIIIQR